MTRNSRNNKTPLANKPHLALATPCNNVKSFAYKFRKETIVKSRQLLEATSNTKMAALPETAVNTRIPKNVTLYFLYYNETQRNKIVALTEPEPKLRRTNMTRHSDSCIHHFLSIDTRFWRNVSNSSKSTCALLSGIKRALLLQPKRRSVTLSKLSMPK